MQNKVQVCTKTCDDLGYGDEIKDEPALGVGCGISAESFYSKPNAKKRSKSGVAAAATAADLDPKITLLQEVKVKLERLPLKEAMDGFSRIKVSPPRKRRGSGERRDGSGKGDGNGGWFAKRAKTDKVGSNLDVYFGNPKLIRPPILNVKATDDSKANKSAAALQPFLPQQPSKRSSYLFGGGDDDDEFERVPDDEVIVTDDTDDEEEDETEDDDDIEVIEVKKKSPKDGFEASAAISPAVIKLEDAISVAAGPVIKAAAPEVQKPVVPIVPDAVPATIPLLMRMKKEASAASAVPAKIRFPAPSSGNRNMIECKWTDCQMSFTTYGKLSDHLRVRAHLRVRVTKEHMHSLVPKYCYVTFTATNVDDVSAVKKGSALTAFHLLLEKGEVNSLHLASNGTPALPVPVPLSMWGSARKNKNPLFSFAAHSQQYERKRTFPPF